MIEVDFKKNLKFEESEITRIVVKTIKVAMRTLKINESMKNSR